ncbi:MAG: PAS domain S-box protein, partial [Betaproteobacteria bacterium]|nr:PAS domain S-box protein [Betaproteobacteria bacterium]
AAHIYTDFVATPYALFRIELVALIVSIIVGLPIFFLIFNLFGQALGGIELKRPIVTVKAKVFLIGALVPLLIDTMLVQYYWTRTGFFTLETFGVWLLLELLAIGGSLIFANSFGQSLGPLQALLDSPRPLPAADVAALTARSTDELGLLTTDYRLLLAELQRRNEILELNNRLLRNVGGETGTAEIFAAVVDQCRQAMGADLSFLVVHDPASGTLLGVAQTDAEYRPEGHYRLTLDEQSLAVWAYVQGQTAVAADAPGDPRVSPKLCTHFGIRSAMATPLKVGDDRLGVLMVAHTASRRDYDDRDRALIEGVARETALVVQTQQLRRARERAEAERVEQAERVRVLMDATEEGIYGVDAHGVCTFINRAAVRMLGYREPHELLGRNLHELIHHTYPDGRPYPVEQCHVRLAALAGEAAHADNEVHWRADGTSFPVEYWSRPIWRNDQLVGTVVSFVDNTERRRAEMALQDATKRFRQALRAARAGAWEWNILTNKTTWSEENFTVLGLDPHTHQASFENWLASVHPEDRERTLREIKEVLDAGSDLNLEFRIVWPNGEVRWINDVGRLVFDETGKPTMMYGIQTDITERKQAQGKILRFGRILDESINEIYVFDATSLRFSQVNFGARKNLGYSMQELSQLTPIDLKPEFTHASFETLLAPLKRGERDLLIFETVHRRKDGSLYPVEVHLQLSLHESPPVFVAVIRDITERKQAEELREASTMQQRAIINVSPVPKALNDEQGNIIFLNPAFTETFGYTLEDIPTLAEWWPKAYPDPAYRQWVVDTWQTSLDKARGNNAAFTPIELNVRCKDGTVKTILASAAPINKSFAGNHLVALYDITARKHAEAERERLLAELTARNIEMEKFVYTISHDLKSPLITISGFIQLLTKDIEVDDRKRALESIGEIRKATKGMQQLIEDLLLFSRTGQIEGEPEEVDLQVLLDDIQERCASHIAQEHATIRITSALPRVRVDRVRFGQVLQ